MQKKLRVNLFKQYLNNVRKGGHRSEEQEETLTNINRLYNA